MLWACGQPLGAGMKALDCIECGGGASWTPTLGVGTLGVGRHRASRVKAMEAILEQIKYMKSSRGRAQDLERAEKDERGLLVCGA